LTDRGKLFAALPPPGPDEHFDTLLDHPAARIERIVSHGHASPPGFWYDQPGGEWVMLVSGRAELAFDDGERLALNAGDWAFIPAHRRHRVEWTSADAVWLAVHLAVS
jgi:cupin 2 domain-containing protein